MEAKTAAAGGGRGERRLRTLTLVRPLCPEDMMMHSVGNTSFMKMVRTLSLGVGSACGALPLQPVLSRVGLCVLVRCSQPLISGGQAGSEFRVAGSNFRVAGSEFRVASSEFRVASS